MIAPSRIYSKARWRAHARLKARYPKKYQAFYEMELAALGLRQQDRERRLTADEELKEMYGV